MKKLLAYIDYGTGGIFFWVMAESPQQLSLRYPKVQILDCAPTWMDYKEVQKLESPRIYDIDSVELAKLAT